MTTTALRPPPPRPPPPPSSSPALAPTPPFELLLRDPEVAAAVERVLGKYGFRAQDLEDGRHDVIVKALEWKGDRPTTLRGTKALSIVIAHAHGSSLYRKAKRREKKGYVGSTDAADEHFTSFASVEMRFDVIDRKKLVALLDAKLPPHIREAFEDVADNDVSQKETAAALGMEYPKLRKEISRYRVDFRKAVLSAGMGALLVGGAIWLFYIHGQTGPAQEAHPTPSAVPTQIVAQEDPNAAAKKQAADLRQQAATACEGKHFDACGELLDQAFALDQAGETDPAVQEIRGQVDDSMRAKPSPAPRPMPKPRK